MDAGRTVGVLEGWGVWSGEKQASVKKNNDAAAILFKPQFVINPNYMVNHASGTIYFNNYGLISPRVLAVFDGAKPTL